ncbi:hypothetical protein GCM10010448_33240 [Streptomyces glomeratus]|uniref:Uncharacterized protein n=1 Tax=Streptomyces glomeratus TaxID=284452 RepID=A0ABP6LPD1_9ACTN
MSAPCSVSAPGGTATTSLSGLTRGKDGKWKVFSFAENGATADPNAIRNAMDDLAATVNGCCA